MMATGKVARPDCLSTFGLLGAVASALTVHFDCPWPVVVKFHPSGGIPTGLLSKFKVSAMASETTTKFDLPRYEAPKIQAMSEKDILNSFQITQSMGVWWNAASC